jgi:hypothetical protein
VLFVLGGGLTALWSLWGLFFVGVGALVGFVLLKSKASALDMDKERGHLEQVRDDLTWLRQSLEHPDGSAHERLRALEVLRRYGRLSPADYEAQRAEIVRGAEDRTDGVSESPQDRAMDDHEQGGPH